jgi:alpha-1,2-mannosyltransferase
MPPKIDGCCMAQLIDTLRTGKWLDKDRMLFYPLVILAATVVSTAYVLISNGGMLDNGSPFGSDFVSFWVAAREALAGHPGAPYDAAAFADAQNAVFGDGNFYAFYYPPHYLAYVLPLGTLPYYIALAAWTVLSFIAALAVLTKIVGRRWEVGLLALAFPATFLTFAHGQNAFLSAALFGGALVVLPTRPVLAGVFIGLLTFKPQLGLLIPIALVAGGYWRTVFSTSLTVVAVGFVSAMLFGVETWSAFLAQGSSAMATLQEGYVGWNKMISTYATLRLAGASNSIAMGTQLIVSVSVAVAVGWAWRKRSGIVYESRCALLLAGCLLATPFVLNYDLFLLAPAIAFVAKKGMLDSFSPYEKSLLAFVYIAPFAVLWLMADGVSVALFIPASLFLYALLHGVSRERTVSANNPVLAE